MGDEQVTKIVWNILQGLLCIGFGVWLGIKIVDIENKSNTIIKAMLCGLIIKAIMLIPSYIVVILLVLLFLSFVFKAYDLEIGESIIALIIIVVSSLIFSIILSLIFAFVVKQLG